MVQAVIVKWIISGFIGWNAMKYYAKRYGTWDPAFADIFFQILFIIVISWKASPIVMNFTGFIENPLAIIVMPGTREGIWAGAAIAAVYAFVEFRKKQLNPWLFGDFMILTAVLAVSVYNVLGWRYGLQTQLPWGISVASPEYRYHPVNAYTILVLVPVLIWSLREGKIAFGRGRVGPNALLFSGAGLLAVSFFQPVVDLYFGLSLLQWAYIAASIAGVGLYAVGQRKFREE